MDFSNLLAEFQTWISPPSPPPPPRGRRCERSEGATATALEFTALPATANSPLPLRPCRQQHRQWRKHTFPCNHSSVAPIRENQQSFYRSWSGIKYKISPYPYPYLLISLSTLSESVRLRKSNEGKRFKIYSAHRPPPPPPQLTYASLYNCIQGEERLEWGRHYRCTSSWLVPRCKVQGEKNWIRLFSFY